MSSRAAAHSPTAARKRRPGVRTDAPVRRTRMSGRAGILLILVFAILALAVSPFRAYLTQRHQISDLQQQTIVLARANETLQARVNKLSDPKELERIARECLGMVRPGETAFVTVPAHGTLTPPRC